MPQRRKIQKGKIKTAHDLGMGLFSLVPKKFVVMDTVKDIADLGHPKPFAKSTYHLGEPLYYFVDRRKGERRSGVDRRTIQVSPIGKVKGEDVFGMSEAEFASLGEPKPERITSKQKLKELGVGKGRVAFKDRRRSKDRRG